MEAVGSTGRREAVISAFQADVVGPCVGPVPAAAFEMWGVPTIFPNRSRLTAMVNQLETELPSRRSGPAIELVGGSRPRRWTGSRQPASAGSAGDKHALVVGGEFAGRSLDRPAVAILDP